MLGALALTPDRTFRTLKAVPTRFVSQGFFHITCLTLHGTIRFFAAGGAGWAYHWRTVI